MKRLFLIILAALAVGCSSEEKSLRTVEDFNFGWHFTLGDDAAYATAEYDHSAWRELRLPHDWSIEGEFSIDNPSTPGGGALPGGIGWYRKSFTVEDYTDKRVFIEFDGVFMNSSVYVNGNEVGHRPYGYSSFSYDITSYLNKAGEENIVAVRCDNSEQPNSRWYAGCGIYRNVRLVVCPDIHVAYSGTYITTPEVSNKSAVANVVVTIENDSDHDRNITLTNTIINANDKQVRKTSKECHIAANSSLDVEMQMQIPSPKMWDIDHPYLYDMVTTIEEGNVILDKYITPFGIRTIEFNAETGFWLNGRNVKLLGVCMHHDLGALGSAVHTRALERQLEILRSFGVNAIRTSHNPPAPEFLDLCDRMGFLVMDEAFDMWRRAKTEFDYSRYFDEWHQKDLIDFIKRDRNHPSIIMWSIGNEILEQWDAENQTLDNLPAEQRNLLMNFLSKSEEGDVSDSEMNPNVLLTRHLVSIVKEYDPTRPVTAGCNETRPINNLLRSGALDIVGFNYHETDYDNVREWYPDKPFIGSETASSINSRGFYLHPSSEIQVHPERWDITYDTEHHQCSAYDNSRTPWGALHEKAWIAVRDRDYCAGTFVWTGFDYLGEPTPYSWPSRSSYFGIVDLCGFPKDCYYMYRAEWTDEPTLHLFPHWNWQKGDKIDIWAYYNTADEVELLVNGRSMGRSKKSEERLHAIWEGVEFEAGEITAIGYKEGKEVLRHTRKTAGKAAKLSLTADRTTIAADGYDLSYITIDCTDSEGNFMPTAMNQLYFELSGAGELVGVDNGNAAGGESLKGKQMKLFNGKALAIVRSLRGTSGKITLTVSGDSVESNAITIESR